MPFITFIEPDGKTHKIKAENGASLMRAAVDNMIEGIIGECGGSCACATCNCFISKEWMDKVGPISEMEEDMLDCVAEYQDNSRLSCQIKITDDLDGLVVHLPNTQS